MFNVHKLGQCIAVHFVLKQQQVFFKTILQLKTADTALDKTTGLMTEKQHLQPLQWIRVNAGLIILLR